MSGLLSLKQQIAANAADLAAVHVTLTAVGLEDISLSDRIAANATLIAGNASSLAALTTSAGETATALADATSGFTTALGGLDAQLTSEIARASTAESQIIATALTDRTAFLAADLAIAGDLATEISRASAAESVLSGRVDDEAVARGVAIAAEVVARDAAVLVERNRAVAAEGVERSRITSEIQARLNAGYAQDAARIVVQKKSVFTHVMEYDGVLAVDSYPFSSGAGVPQAAGFGVGIPLSYEFVGFYVQCLSAQEGGTVGFAIEGYASGSVSSEWVYSPTLTLSGSKSLGLNVAPRNGSAGSVCVKVVSASGPVVSDVAARYRISLYFRSLAEF